MIWINVVKTMRAKALPKVIVTGAAGLVGQNLMFELENDYNVVAIDKHEYNIRILKKYHPNVKTVRADLSVNSSWNKEFKNAKYLIMLHAQISSPNRQDFIRNNITATRNVLAAAKNYKLTYIVHVSSSVVIASANDYYTNTKKEQELLVKQSGIPYVVLRPVLMFGWFDKKHLGWLSRFMKRTPIFPIPGTGKYVRQPLFVQDFCKVIAACLKRKPNKKTYNIIGIKKIYYIDLIKKIKHIKGLKTIILPIPTPLFSILMRIYGFFSSKPPFTPDQLKALVAGDEFPVWDWWSHFKIKPTPLDKALIKTFKGKYSNIVLKP